jgi:hypothetical protein
MMCKESIKMFEKGCVVTLIVTKYKCMKLVNQHTAIFCRLKKNGMPGKKCLRLSRDPLRYINVPLNIKGLAV